MNLKMFVRQDVAEKIARARKALLVPTAQQRADFHIAMAVRPTLASRTDGARASKNAPDNYCVVGSTAQIGVCGLLSEQEDFWAWLLGYDQTAYSDIRDSFALAESDPAVANVEMVVASPGGYVDGLFETLAAVEAFSKPIRVVSSQACSAAYSLAAMGGKIRATGPSAEFGSVGVAASYWIDPEHQIDIASTEAPNKRPDLSTEEGRAIVRAELDAVHELFVEAIARGRQNATGSKYTIDQVNATFGRGGVLLAKEALDAGMIDKVQKSPKRGSSALDDEGDEAPPAAPVLAAVPATAITPQPEAAASGTDSRPEPQRTSAPKSGQRKKTMTKEELKAQFPETYNAIFADGETSGRTAENERVCAHIQMGESCGTMSLATKAIKDGVAFMHAPTQAAYMSAAMNRSDKANRQADSDSAGAVVEGTAPAASAADGQDFGDQVAAEFDRQRGKTTTTAPFRKAV
jgi:ClpP class serine protease